MAALALASASTVGAAGEAPHRHGSASDLAGLTLCVDASSLRVRFAGEHGGESGRVEALVRERLERAVERTLGGAGVPWRRVDACPPGRGYLEAVLDVAPAAEAGPRAFVYEAAVRVGWRRTTADGAVVAPADAFDFTQRERFDESVVRTPAFVFLPAYVEAGLRDLSVAWWEDTSARPRRPAPALVAGVVLGVAVAAWTALVRWWRRR